MCCCFVGGGVVLWHDALKIDCDINGMDSLCLGILFCFGYSTVFLNGGKRKCGESERYLWCDVYVRTC